MPPPHDVLDNIVVGDERHGGGLYAPVDAECPPPAGIEEEGGLLPTSSAQRWGGRPRARRGHEREDAEDIMGDESLSFVPKPTRLAPTRKFVVRRGGWLESLMEGVGGKAFVGRLAVWLLIVVLAIAWTYRAHRDHKLVLKKRHRLADRLTWAASYLVDSCDVDGRFRYAARANGRPHPHTEEYSVLHHGLVLHALAEYKSYRDAGELQLGRPKKGPKGAHLVGGVDVSEALMRGVGYLLRRLEHAPNADAGSYVRDGEMASLAVWDHRGGGEKVASLSATAMALVSLVRVDWALGGAVDLRVLRKLGAFIVGMQRRDGLFHRYLIMGGTSRLDRAHPLTGEAIPGQFNEPPPVSGGSGKEAIQLDGTIRDGGLPCYALMLLSERDADDNEPRLEWLKPAVRGLMGDEEQSGRLQDSDVNWKPSTDQHWTLVAAAELLSPFSPLLNVSHLPRWRQQAFTDHWDSKVWDVGEIREKVTSHSLRLLEPILSEYELLPAYTHHTQGDQLFGALTLHGESFITAQRMRALESVLEFLPMSERDVPFYASDQQRQDVRSQALLRERIERILRKAGGYLEQIQVTHQYNPMKGGFTRALVPHPVRFTDEAKAFNEMLNEIRMDYVADALLALMPYRTLLLREAAAGGLLYEDGHMGPPPLA